MNLQMFALAIIEHTDLSFRDTEIGTKHLIENFTEYKDYLALFDKPKFEF